MLEEILVASRALVELGEPEMGEGASKLCAELRLRRRTLLDRLCSENSGKHG